MILQLDVKFPISTKVRYNNKIGKDEGTVTGLIIDIASTIFMKLLRVIRILKDIMILNWKKLNKNIKLCG